MKPISSDLSDIKKHYEVVVIGSGYGGGIAASRMARAGCSVCLLERGREILVGDYPDTLTEATKNTQFHTPKAHIGSPLGLYDIHVNEQQSVVVGCGLGGTSLINANVSLEAQPEVFDDPCWPSGIREHRDTLLQKGYVHARDMLKPTPYPQSRDEPAKLKAHRISAEALANERELKFYKPPINVTFETPEGGVNHVGVPQSACTDCGDCVSGCNYGAKNTTLMNYLPDAWNHGAEIFCQAEVQHIQKDGNGWIVHYQPVDVGRGKFGASPLFVKADIVVLAAGTLGSNEIMLRSKKHGLPVSDRVGHNFSGNGDILGFGYNCDVPVNGIGFGTRKPGEIPAVGPCITSVIDLRQGNDWEKRMVIEEGSIPGALGSTLPLSLAVAAGAIGEDTDEGIIDKIREEARIAESYLRGPYHGAVNATQTFLIMSHDDARGQAKLNDQDRMIIDWPDVGDQDNVTIGNENLRKATEALGGTFVKNPVWTPLLRNSLVTVHPLGGCVMAENGSEGVVNHKGQVFTGDSEEVYSGLYISDGSVIPRSLAVNPLLTISAISERCCHLIAEDNGWSIDYSLPSKPKREHPKRKLGIRFTETMKGFFSTTPNSGENLESYRQAAAEGKRTDSTLEFTLTIESQDLETTLNSEEHSADISGTVSCPALSSQPLSVSGGVFNLFEQMPSPPDTRHMIYAMTLTSEEGSSFYFKGYKLVKKGSSMLNVWSDTSTLYVSIHRGGAKAVHCLAKPYYALSPRILPFK